MELKNGVVKDIMNDIEYLKFINPGIHPIEYDYCLDEINCKITKILVDHRYKLEELSKEYIKLADKTAMWDKVGRTYYECKRRIK
jgi:hypothetical protein